MEQCSLIRFREGTFILDVADLSAARGFKP